MCVLHFVIKQRLMFMKSISHFKFISLLLFQEFCLFFLDFPTLYLQSALRIWFTFWFSIRLFVCLLVCSSILYLRMFPLSSLINLFYVFPFVFPLFSPCCFRIIPFRQMLFLHKFRFSSLFLLDIPLHSLLLDTDVVCFYANLNDSHLLSWSTW